jgi:tetratricopeptide (TPR) repeat protein
MTSRLQKLLVLVAGFILVPGLIAAAKLGEGAMNAVKVEGIQSYSVEDAEILTSLKEFAKTVDSSPNGFIPQPRELLPDVDEMIDRLAVRLQTTPQDKEGWQMLGWSYLNTGRYALAADAYKKAIALDPDSQELKLAYQQAMSKASEVPTTANGRRPIIE